MQIPLRYTYFLISLLISLLSCLQLFSSDIYQAPLTPRRFIVPEKIQHDTLSLKKFKGPMVVDPIFMPVVFTGKILPEGYLKKNPYKHPKLSDIENIMSNHMILNMPSSLFEKRRREQELRRKAYLYLSMADPSIVKYTLNDFPETTDVIEQLAVNPFKNLFKIETDFSYSGTPSMFVFRKYWFVNGDHLLQFSQNYISDNWNSGGLGNLNFLSNQNMKVNYEKSKVQFNTYLEWNASLYTNPKDTLRIIKIGTDLLRSYSNIGFRAFKHWYYSTNLELKTQIFNNYAENSQTKISSFMSPFFLNVGILGMRYELDRKFKNDKYKSLKLSADFSPLSIKYVSVRDLDVDPSRYGIQEGKNSQLFFGSTVNATMIYKLNRSTSLKSRFKYFTNFDKVEIESENEMNFSINRYFSTRIYLYLRYDDSENVPRDSKLGYLQINELLSFGFNYKW